MTSFVPMEPGQWVLAFDQPYGPYDRTMEEHLANFSSRGGGWDHIRPTEIFLVHQVWKVMPKTYTGSVPVGGTKSAASVERFERACIIAVGKSERDMIRLRDKFYEIGDAADYAIEAETDRRMAKFRERRYAKAEKKIHKLFPHFFGRGDA
jgi:hypothetical protein